MKELSEVLQDWEAVIGLEIHTELTALDTKMFCNCKLSHDDEPNANVCTVCLGLPGALPVPNKRAIESIVKAGLATNCEIQRHSMFYRKHYFYPDMAKNFQTTQGPVAFAMYGHLDLDVTGRGAAERPDCAFGEAEAQSLASASANAEGLSTSMSSTMREGNQRAGHLASYDASNLQMPERREDGSYTVPIRILRIHMEEDAAKMVHVGGAEGRITAAAESLVDYNRCGTPLIELVTEPDLRTPEEARLFMEKLRRIFVTLGISDCSMEKGSMRCDGNVSLRRRGETKLGTKTELKNLNSFKSLHDGLAYEICRQAEVLEEGGIIYQETRHWEPSRKRRRLKAKIQNHHRCIRNIRRDFMLKTAHTIAQKYGWVAMENLNLKNMTKSAKGTVEEPGKNVSAKSGLNRSLARVAPYAMRMAILWAVFKAGGTLVLVDPRYTSQTCPICGYTSAKNRPTQAHFGCLKCGYTENADCVAAVNILKKSRTSSVRPCSELGNKTSAGTVLFFAV